MWDMVEWLVDFTLCNAIAQRRARQVGYIKLSKTLNYGDSKGFQYNFLDRFDNVQENSLVVDDYYSLKNDIYNGKLDLSIIDTLFSIAQDKMLCYAKMRTQEKNLEFIGSKIFSSRAKVRDKILYKDVVKQIKDNIEQVKEDLQKNDYFSVIERYS